MVPALWHNLHLDSKSVSVQYVLRGKQTHANPVQAPARRAAIESSRVGELLGREHSHRGAMGAGPRTHTARGLSCPAHPCADEAHQVVHFVLVLGTAVLCGARIMSTFRRHRRVGVGAHSREGERVTGSESKSGKMHTKGRHSISYQTFQGVSESQSDGTECATANRTMQISPISNAPNDESDKGVPSQRELSIYRLRRDLAHREQQLSEVLFKLSKALEVVVSEEQFFTDGMQRGIWETYGQLMRRRSRLKAVREMIMAVGSARILDPKEEEELKRKIGLE